MKKLKSKFYYDKIKKFGLKENKDSTNIIVEKKEQKEEIGILKKLKKILGILLNKQQ